MTLTSYLTTIFSVSKITSRIIYAGVVIEQFLQEIKTTKLSCYAIIENSTDGKFVVFSPFFISLLKTLKKYIFSSTLMCCFLKIKKIQI